jgi:DNA-binding CsgD family transcriptional regulator
MEPVPNLTPTQTRIVYLLAAGNSIAQVAEALGLVRGTVNYHIDRIKQELNAKTLPHVIARCYDHGILTPYFTQEMITQMHTLGDNNFTVTVVQGPTDNA